MPKPTPSQTIGPFFAYCLTSSEYGYTLVADNSLKSPSGKKIKISGKVYDGGQNPVPDAMLEIWQADPEGHLPGEQPDGANRPFRGFGRCATNPDGTFRFRTLPPGPTTGPDGGVQAPHIAVVVFARGVLNRLATRIYFAGDPRNDADAVLAAVPEARRGTLLASDEGPGVWRWDVRLQGDLETAFLRC